MICPQGENGFISVFPATAARPHNWLDWPWISLIRVSFFFFFFSRDVDPFNLLRISDIGVD